MFAMGSRKRAKQNPTAESSTPHLSPAMSSLASLSAKAASKSSKLQTPATEEPPATPTTATPSVPGTPRSSKAVASNGDATPSAKQVQKARSWYGSWPRVPKSSASTQLARETIMGGTANPAGVADFSRLESKKTPDSMSIVDDATSPTTTLSKAPKEGGSVGKARIEQHSRDSSAPSVAEAVVNHENEAKAENGVTQLVSNNDDLPKTSPPADQQQPTESPAEAQPTSIVEPAPQKPASGWFSWLGWSSNPETTASKHEPVSEPSTQNIGDPAVVGANSSQTAAPEANKAEQCTVQATSQLERRDETPSQVSPQDHSQAPEQESTPMAPKSSWFWSWSYSYWAAPTPSATSAQAEQSPGTEQSQDTKQPQTVVPLLSPQEQPKDRVVEEHSTAKPSSETPAPRSRSGTTWAFWSRDTGSGLKKGAVQRGEQGQLAVMGESSETHPRIVNSVDVKGNEAPVKEPTLKAGQKDQQKDQKKEQKKDQHKDQQKDQQQAKVDASAPSQDVPKPATRETFKSSNKRGRVQSTEAVPDASIPVPPSPPKPDAAAQSVSSKAPSISIKPAPPNLLLPSFTSTYRLKESPSILKQIARLVLRTQSSSQRHVFITNNPPKIKKALAIGVHGLFPAQYLRAMLGQPTGTSIKFANNCADAIRRWVDSHGCSDCEIEKIALEGEGKIGERVTNLWKLLMNWVDLIRQADLVIFACHSQGVPVSMMLLAKLIELGIVKTARVGVCAMAGVSLGPFPDYRSSVGRLMGSAAELWEFSDPNSEVSKRLESAVKIVLAYGARVTYIGSMDDQLVPLESAIYAPAHHPYIFRAVFIDGRIHAPDFIAHLVGFALKLRNLGVSDHGLIRELSAPLAGSLYSGEGHSRLYEDPQLYDLAVAHALETTDISGGSPPCEFRPRAPGGLSNPNPYHLPWIMRGLLEEEFVKTELATEMRELVQQFDDWKPVTKALKDVKYRLEAVRSKL